MIFQGDSNILLWPRSHFRWQSKGSGFSRRANFPKSGDDWISQSCCSRVCSGFYRVSVVTFGLVRMGQRVFGTLWAYLSKFSATKSVWDVFMDRPSLYLQIFDSSREVFLIRVLVDFPDGALTWSQSSYKKGEKGLAEFHYFSAIGHPRTLNEWTSQSLDPLDSFRGKFFTRVLIVGHRTCTRSQSICFLQ